MRVLINEIVCSKLNIIVAFSSDFGHAIADWNGEVPKINREYQVEFDINNTLTWEKDITKRGKNTKLIQQSGGAIQIYGDIDSIDDDGYTVLRIGDSIIPFLTTGTPFPVGTSVVLSTEKITLSPIDY